MASFLSATADEGLAMRFDQMRASGVDVDDAMDTRYRERLAFELGVINSMGFPGYFLIVMEFIQWAKDHDIPVGPGRGSGQGLSSPSSLRSRTLTARVRLAVRAIFEP